MSGKKGQKGWMKREEFYWRELMKESQTVLLKLGKKYHKKLEEIGFDIEKIEEIVSDQDKRKLFDKVIEIMTAITLKSIPSKIEGEGFEHKTIIVQWKDPNDRENRNRLLPTPESEESAL